MDDFMSTPVVRPGPTSRLLRRQSGLPEPRNLKESNLEKSLHLLDDALGSPSYSSATGRFGRNLDVTSDLTRIHDVSRIHDVTSIQDITRFQDTTRTMRRDMAGDITRADMDVSMSTTLHSAMLEENPGVKATETLFDEFLSVCSTGAQGLDSIAEFEQMVDDHIQTLRRVTINLPGGKDKFPKTAAVLQDLINERNTWRIMGKLYTDRLVTCSQTPPDLPPPAPGSEKQIIERFFMNNKDIRQAYMVVEWLEKNAQDETEQTITQQMEWFTDSTVNWENTTAALARGQAGHLMVKELDPDAPHRTGLQLHDLDQQDESRLIFCIYGLVRCGLLEDAQELCVRLGQPWRAASMEGWRLYHDPNYESGTDGRGDKLPVEGNLHRDIWKKVAWKLTTDSSLSQHERAVYAVLCGNLEQLRAVSTSWEDRLWAGAKCAVDILVETEIRSNIIKNYAELPTAYWNTPHELSKVIKEAGNKTKVSSTKSAFFYHTIQSHIILDDYPGLVSTLVSWLKDGEADDHLLRLMAHLVLVHRGLGLGSSMKDEEMILVEYTRYLMKEDRLPIIPWYVSRLSSEIQLPLYSRFLAGVHEVEDQALCLYLGREVGINMDAIVVAAVVDVRTSHAVDNEQMVSSLGWLCHDPSQAPDLLYQANAVIRKLLSVGQLELAAQAAGRIPKETLNRVVRAWRDEDSGEELPGGSVREHLSLKVYLEAQDAFSDWFDHFHRGQPKRPILPENPSFTEKVAHEQREKQFMAELDRWRGGQVIQSRNAEQKLKEVITFPGGWLTDITDEDEEEELLVDEELRRRDEMVHLRAELIPQTVLLLHSVLHNTGQYKACVALANLISDESMKNYTAFSKERMKQFLAKIRESSLAALEEGKDAWGFNKQ